MTALTDFQAAATTFLAAAATYAADAGAVASVTQGGYTFHFDTVGNTFVRSTETRTGAPSDSLDDFLLDVATYRAEAGAQDFLQLGRYNAQFAGDTLSTLAPDSSYRGFV